MKESIDGRQEDELLALVRDVQLCNVQKTTLFCHSAMFIYTAVEFSSLLPLTSYSYVQFRDQILQHSAHSVIAFIHNNQIE